MSLNDDVEMPRPSVQASRVLESCNSTWLFDDDRARFRRVPRGARLDFPASDAEWEPFHGLELLPETGAFVVHLNTTGTKLLRAYQHADPCEHCDQDATGELSLIAAELT